MNSVGPATTFDDQTLAIRQSMSQSGFFRALAHGSPGARLVELDGVQATVVPARPWFGIFSSVFYEDSARLAAALPRLVDEYARSGVFAWSVWVPPEDSDTPGLLAKYGFVREASPLRMAAAISEIGWESDDDLDLLADPTWEIVARCNDRAWGVLAEWTMAAAFETMHDSASHLYAVKGMGRDVVAALIAREESEDCYLWFVATVPDAQRKGIGARLVRHALKEAGRRGCRTTSLESSSAGERLYATLGYRSLGRYRRFERRVS